MIDDPQLNGCDYLMLGFDYELRRHGYAGNSCQIVLELANEVPMEELRKRMAAIIGRHPVLQSRPGGIFLPKWKSAGRTMLGPQYRVQPEDAQIRQKLFNEPLAIGRGELLRFDLIQRADGGSSLVFTWAHALMDAPGAEHLLALLGCGNTPSLCEKVPPRSLRPRRRLSERCKLAWKNLHQLDQFCQAPPRTMGTRNPAAPAACRYFVEKFSTEETARVRANAVTHCGMLGDAQFHAAAAVLELHRLHRQLDCPSPSYVLPVPVGLRPKGGIEPLFSNQVAMLMVQFLPEHLGNMADAVSALKSQTERSMRAGLLESGLMLSELFRFLPLPIYVAVLKRGLRGEICSLFYGDTAAVNPGLTDFLGVPVEDFAHVAAVTPSPGLGVVFYYFRGQLRVTILHSARVLDDTEAAGFGAGLRHRLLNP